MRGTWQRTYRSGSSVCRTATILLPCVWGQGEAAHLYSKTEAEASARAASAARFFLFCELITCIRITGLR